jgi:phospholipid/cholesterol/gamma-HCH transport system ATP-binding protein
MESGKINLIIGSSGSGKTVLMKCIIGLIPLDSGQILYDGRNFTELDDKDKKELRTQIGMLFQGSALFDSLTVEQNVMFPLDMFTKMGASEKKKRVNEVLDRVNLVDTNLKFPAELSGGMKKRVALARAIVLNPKYLFCDEPNSGLDPYTSIVIDNLIQEITEEFGITTVINTHDMNSVLEIGQKIIYLNKGQKWWEGDKHSILETDNEEVNNFVYASELFKRIRKASKG